MAADRPAHASDIAASARTANASAPARLVNVTSPVPSALPLPRFPGTYELQASHASMNPEVPGRERQRLVRAAARHRPFHQPAYPVERACAGRRPGEVSGAATLGDRGHRPAREYPSSRQHGAAAGDAVEHAGAVDIGHQPVEYRLAHPVRGRAQARALGEGEAPRAPLPGDDAQLAAAAVLGCGAGLAHQCSGGPAGRSAGLAVGGGSGCCATVGPAVTITSLFTSRCLAMAALTCSTPRAWVSAMKSSR